MYVCVFAGVLDTNCFLCYPLYGRCSDFFGFKNFVFLLKFFFCCCSHSRVLFKAFIIVFFITFAPIRLSQPWLLDFVCWWLRWKAFESARNLILKFSNYFLLKVNTVKIAIKKIGQLRWVGVGCGRGCRRVRVRGVGAGGGHVQTECAGQCTYIHTMVI